MQAILISVALLLGGGAIHTKYPETVVMDRQDHIETINTIESMIEWMDSDVENDIISKEVGEDYRDNLNDILFVLKNRTIIIENED